MTKQTKTGFWLWGIFIGIWLMLVAIPATRHHTLTATGFVGGCLLGIVCAFFFLHHMVMKEKDSGLSMMFDAIDHCIEQFQEWRKQRAYEAELKRTNGDIPRTDSKDR